MSLLQQFKDECRKLPTTESIFAIKVGTGGWQGTCLLLEPVNKINSYDLVTDDLWKTDPIKALAMNTSRETIDYSTKTYYISIENSLHNLYSKLRTSIASFINHNSGRDSDLYKWYDNHALRENVLSNRYLEPMLGLFKYISANSDGDFVINDEKHKQNALAILELIYQRDSRPEHVPQPRRRRSRRRK